NVEGGRHGTRKIACLGGQSTTVNDKGRARTWLHTLRRLLTEAYSLACAVAVPAVFQTRITPSSPADSRRRPSAEKVTARTGPAWPRKTRGPRPLRKSHSFTCPSSPAEASRRSPCANASEVIRPWCARKERWGREEEVDHSRTAPVMLPLARLRPPGDISSTLGLSPWPRQVRARLLVSVRHSRMLWSWPADANSPR